MGIIAKSAQRKENISRRVLRSRIFRLSQTHTSLLRRVRDVKDAASWAEFVRFYEPLLQNYVRARGLPAADADDVVQEIFLKLLRALPEFTLDRRQGRFRTWLYQVTMSAVYDHVRRKSARDRTVAEWWKNVGKEQAVDELPPEDWSRVHQRRAVEVTEAEMKASINPNTWRCYEQHFHNGRKFADIAAELGITANAACVNAGRVLEKVSSLSAQKLRELDDE
jgi:RNA polymerase sigma-70 factor, ECF subfamily